jgi:hypothetical protein
MYVARRINVPNLLQLTKMDYLLQRNAADILLKSTCDVNLLSKVSIIFKEWRVMNNVDRGGVIVLFVL